jgi:hypothetical protein
MAHVYLFRLQTLETKMNIIKKIAKWAFQGLPHRETEEEKNERVKIANWDRLYEKLHGHRPTCAGDKYNCAHFQDCVRKFTPGAMGKEGWPYISPTEVGCMKYKAEDVAQPIPTGSGWSNGRQGPPGFSGYTGISGSNVSGWTGQSFRGYTKIIK